VGGSVWGSEGVGVSTKTELTFRINDELVRLEQVTRSDIADMFDQIRNYTGKGFSEIEIYDDEIRSHVDLSINNRLYRMTYGIFPDTGEDEVFLYSSLDKHSNDLVEFYGEMVGSSSLFTDSRIAEEKFYESLEKRSLDLTNFV
jgi:hypothetical protein